MTSTITRLSLPLLLILAVAFSATQASAQTPYHDAPRPAKTIEDLSADEVILTVLAGEAAMIAGAVGGSFLGAMAGVAATPDDCTDWCGLGGFILGGVAGGGAGGLLGVSAGVTLTGNALGYDGSYAGSLLGSSLGLGASLGLMAIDDFEEVGVVALFILPVAGATAGYFLGASSKEDFSRNRARGSLLNYNRDEGLALGVPAVGITPTKEGTTYTLPILGGHF